jgi:hypothetical protein
MPSISTYLAYPDLGLISSLRNTKAQESREKSGVFPVVSTMRSPVQERLVTPKIETDAYQEPIMKLARGRPSDTCMCKTLLVNKQKSRSMRSSGGVESLPIKQSGGPGQRSSSCSALHSTSFSWLSEAVLGIEQGLDSSRKVSYTESAGVYMALIIMLVYLLYIWGLTCSSACFVKHQVLAAYPLPSLHNFKPCVSRPRHCTGNCPMRICSSIKHILYRHSLDSLIGPERCN